MTGIEGRSVNRWGCGSLLAGALAAGVAALSPAVGAAASGDLDPAFAVQGLYLRPAAARGAWTIDLLGDAYLLAGIGGRAGFMERLTESGLLDSSFVYSRSTQILDVAVQADGRIVAVGRQEESTDSDLPTRPSYSRKVLRLNPDGSSDTTFDPPPTIPQRSYANANSSVVLSTGGRIVVAGNSNGLLIVERFLPDGALDATFADGGRFLGPALVGGETTVVAVPGGYRVLGNFVMDGTCRVVALTDDGHVDTSYAGRGYATPGAAANGPTICASMIALADGRMEIVGERAGAAFATRLTGAGDLDSGFDAVDVPTWLRTADSVAIDADGNSVVVGTSMGGESGLRVVRLDADGATDTGFGSAGTAWVDLMSAALRDLVLLPGGAVLLAGGAMMPDRTRAAVAVRLLGATGTSGPGVLGFKWARVDVTQQATEAVLTVRRTGGASGPASVSYRTRALDTLPLTSVTTPATEDVDYARVSGHLSWTSGDASERVIHVRLGPEDAVMEDFEGFEVELADATGASLGTAIATVVIGADGGPAGYVVLDNHDLGIAESGGSVSVPVTRKYYGTGAVSVRVTLKSSTAAAGSDFDDTPLTLTWADGEVGTRYATIPISNDTVNERTETFTLELTDATGGALIEPGSSATVTIFDDDPLPADVANGGAGGGGGGGRLDWFLLALLVAVARTLVRDVNTRRTP